MSAVSQLIKVSYQDKTNYTNEVGGDVMGTMFYHHWGPSELTVLSEADFFSLFPTNIDQSVDPTNYAPYAAIVQAFNNGINTVEVMRLHSAGEQLLGVTLSAGSDKQASVWSALSGEPGTNYCMYARQKYYGTPFPGRNVKVSIKADAGQTDGQLTLRVSRLKEGSAEVFEDLETFVGYPYKNVINGVDYSLEAQAAESEYLEVKCKSKSLYGKNTINPSLESVFDYHAPKEAWAVPAGEKQPFALGSKTLTSFKEVISVFGDSRVSQATMIVDTSFDGGQADEYMEAANEAQDRIAVVSGGTNISKDALETKLNALKNNAGIFTVAVNGIELVTLNDINVQTQCVGGFAGRTAYMTRNYRTNQPASAFTYGGYNGVLYKTLGFNEVLELHELGMGSVFNDITGPLIWCVRSPYRFQTSYFAKFNVVRVLAEILRSVFPLALQAIHTDAAANEITASSYEAKFSNILDYEVAQQNIKSDSVAICTGSINSDSATKGGKIFNILLSIHFIGLVEKVNISVVATDSSVSAEIV